MNGPKENIQVVLFNPAKFRVQRSLRPRLARLVEVCPAHLEFCDKRSSNSDSTKICEYSLTVISFEVLKKSNFTQKSQNEMINCPF